MISHATTRIRIKHGNKDYSLKRLRVKSGVSQWKEGIPQPKKRVLKYTLCLTQQCNLRCKYCYVVKGAPYMPLDIGKKIIDFIFHRTPPGEKMIIGFFGGEPLLEFELMKALTELIEEHPEHDQHPVEFSLVTNGTIYSHVIADFIEQHDFGFGISCDGPPELHNRYRLYINGKGSGNRVEKNIMQAIQRFPNLMVNAVYRPDTLQNLPEVVDYFASLGVTQIYLNPDFSADWSIHEANILPEIYGLLGERYVNSYIVGKPLYISLIDSKISVILRGGYQTEEKCSMGRGELAFTPNGNIFPCERLIGAGDGDGHCIGHIDEGVVPERMQCSTSSTVNVECLTCGLQEYCTHWCGCSNYFSSGYYNRVGPFLCASERASIIVAHQAIQQLETRLGSLFSDHLAGDPAINSATS